MFDPRGIGVLCAILMGGVSAGCSSNSAGKVLVSGTVSFQDRPLEIGQIRFIPQAGAKGPVTICRIEQGTYTSQASGGVAIGKHRVEILGYDAKEYASTPAGPGVPPIKQLIPDKYNRSSELSFTLEPSPAEQTHDFNLTP